jgi:hypothetical protein
MTIEPIAPTAAHAALALEEAQRLTGDNPARYRMVAMGAMMRAFPHVQAMQLGEVLSIANAKRANAAVRKCRESSNWWNEARVEEVTGALVAERYGERAQ